MFKILHRDTLPGPTPRRLHELREPIAGKCTHCAGPVPAADAWRGAVGLAGRQCQAVLLCEPCALALSIWLYGVQP
jgi:hypothetical protein